jgi:hypothetical protein
MSIYKLRYKLLQLKRSIVRQFSRKWELFKTPKEYRPVKKLIWQKFDEAQEQMITELSNEMFGDGTSNFDGLASIVDDKK